MHLEERYQRVDWDTIHFTLKIDDPMAYSRPWMALARDFKLRPRAEIRQGYCVASEEQSFTKRIREPGALNTGAAPKVAHEGKSTISALQDAPLEAWT
jgi:hypothetical protein